MHDIKFTLLPPPALLKDDVECIRIAEYTGRHAIPIHVCPSGGSGLFVQVHDGRSAMENITMASGRSVTPPTVFIAGQCTDSSTIRVTRGVFTMVIFKPHALNTLFGMNAAVLTDNYAELDAFGFPDLASQLVQSPDEPARLSLLTRFLLTLRTRAQTPDCLIQESLRLINANIGSITVKALLEGFHLSERQFEKRFVETVGVTPRFYLRVRRFNEAAYRLKMKQFHTLGELAHALHYYDQSHFIRDIRSFAGMTPGHLSQKADDLHHDHLNASFIK